MRDDYKQIEQEAPDETEYEDDDDFVEASLDIQFIQSKLSCLAPKRVEEAKYWYAILQGVHSFMVQYNLDIYAVEDVMREWSQSTTKGNYTDDSFDRAWNEVPTQRFTMDETLIRWARQDSWIIHTMLRARNEDFAQVMKKHHKGSLYITKAGKGVMEGCYYNPETSLWNIVDKTQIAGLVLPCLKLEG